MRTQFSLAQLADPATAEAEQILRTCVHCGFCTATCPSFVVQRDELDSPRGRIYLIKEMLENDRPADAQTTLHLDRCLSCLSCTTTCPSGVDYMHLIDIGRAHVEKTYRRPLADRMIRWTLAKILPYRGRVRAALGLAMPVKALAPVVEAIPGIGPRLAAMLRLAPTGGVARLATDRPGTWSPKAAPKARVVLLQGCVQPVLRPAVNDATIRVLNRAGVEVVQVAGEGCCGALVHHMGRDDEARHQAARNLDLWWGETLEGGGAGLDAILITASGCGTSIKDYGHLFAEDPVRAEKAKIIAGLALDVTQYLARLDVAVPSLASAGRDAYPLTVAYHSACSMQHGQKIKDEPRNVLRAAGFKVVEIAEGHLCCGSAGVYNILQPEIAGQLRARKAGNIHATKPDVVATGNIGCITQLAGALDVPIVHTVELIDWAQGGPAPAGVTQAISA